MVNAYAYNNAPSQFFSAIAALSAGETANGGKPFDLLLTATPPTGASPLPQDYWSIDLSNEVGNLDGITSLNVTDFGAIAPEPSTVGLVVTFALLALPRRQHER